jgi:hypothetical protein
MHTAMLSTSDNPYNPFTDWKQWYAFDTQNGYNSCAYLARMCDAYADASPDDEEKSYEDAIDRICKLNLTGNYIKVYADTKINT